MAGGATTLGSAIPPLTAHAISVSLPTWRDNVGYEEGEERVVSAMVSGYPRFFIHLSVLKLAGICEQKFGLAGEKCLLLPTKRIAEFCRSFMQARWLLQSDTPLNVRLVHFVIFPEERQQQQGKMSPGVVANGASSSSTSPSQPTTKTGTCADLHIALFPEFAAPVAKQFWQHTGLGISSRLAEHCLSMLPNDTSDRQPPSPTPKSVNRHYASRSFSRPKCDPAVPQPKSPIAPGSPTTTTNADGENLSRDQFAYVEERYGRNLPVDLASKAKRMLRCRIAGVLVHDTSSVSTPLDGDVQVGPSSRGVASVTEDDVYLFPCGMAAIWTAHHLLSSVRPPAQSVCFGFTYTDTLKILQKWGPGCHLLGHGLESDIDELESILEAEPNKPPVLALFTEFPSNPLLRSANLPRLRALADKYDFLIVIDETIGNFVNVRVFPYADIIVSSLTKIFSGDANVMGGSLVLNPERRHYEALKAHMSANYEDVYFDEDAVFMERNSRNFQRRIRVVDVNTQAVCQLLRSRSVEGGGGSCSAIKNVFYPEWVTRENYERCRITDGGENGDEHEEGGFGGLFSLTFTSPAASRAFFDALPFHKGPSLGANFTLACPYTILAHYTELEWAAKYGVEEGLVRISVGMEESKVLLDEFETALRAAEAVVVRPS